MADVKKKGFKTLETDYEELDIQIHEHRKQIFKRGLQVIVLIVMLVIVLNLMYALRSYENYEVHNVIDRNSSGTTQYQMFGDYLLEYSSDGISCIAQKVITVAILCKISIDKIEKT